MEPGGTTSHSQGLSNNTYPGPNLPNYRINTFLEMHSNIFLCAYTFLKACFSFLNHSLTSLNIFEVGIHSSKLKTFN